VARWGALSTEASNPSSEGLDTLSSEEVVSLLLEEDQRGLAIARRSQEGIAQAASWVAEVLDGGGTMLFAGAGTSGRLGILEAAECPPTFGTDPEQIRAVIAGGPEAVFEAREGAEDIAEDGAQAADELGAGDLLIAVSASSATPFVLGALGSARDNGARTILVTCTPPGEIAEVADLVLALDTGPEVLTGSTRLKAASATKAVLNAITTAAKAPGPGAAHRRNCGRCLPRGSGAALRRRRRRGQDGDRHGSVRAQGGALPRAIAGGRGPHQEGPGRPVNSREGRLRLI